MRASLSKRMTAYVIDIIILSIVLFLTSILFKSDVSSLNKMMDTITLDYFNGDISFNTYLLEQSSIYKQIDMKNILLNVINIIFIIGYFIVLPYLNKGKTIGKMFMKIEVKAKSNQSLSLVSLTIRNLIINGLIYLVSVIICTVLVSENIYFITVSGLAIIQIALLLISITMVLYRKDRKGLHDLLAGTWVAAEK